MFVLLLLFYFILVKISPLADSKGTSRKYAVALAVVAVAIALAGNLHLSVDTLSGSVLSSASQTVKDYIIHQGQQADKYFVSKVSTTFGFTLGRQSEQGVSCAVQRLQRRCRQ